MDIVINIVVGGLALLTALLVIGAYTAFCLIMFGMTHDGEFRLDLMIAGMVGIPIVGVGCYYLGGWLIAHSSLGAIFS